MIKDILLVSMFKIHLLNVRVLHQITGITECRQCIYRQVSVTAAKTLPTLRLINGDDLEAKQVHKKIKIIDTSET